MNRAQKNTQIISRLMFQLLPIQILLAVIGAVNGIVSSLFAGNYVGQLGMGAVGLYAPIASLITSLSTMLVAGAQILCGRSMGENQTEKTHNIFTLDIIGTLIISGLFTAAVLVIGLFDLSGFLTKDLTLRPLLNRYMIGQSIGIIPAMLSGQFAAFLSLENKTKRTTYASMIYILINVVLNFLFVGVLKMDAFGLALASSLGMWIFLGAEAQYFLTGKSFLRFSLKHMQWKAFADIIRLGFPSAIVNIYQTVRGLIVNSLLQAYVGSVGVSAFAAANTLLGFAWAIPGGMIVVSRMLISISMGEEDRTTLADVMRTAMKRYVPLMCLAAAIIIACAVPLTHLYYREPAELVYGMTVWGFRILPLCMPLSVICMHLSCYALVNERHFLVHVTGLLDGVVCVAGFTALLIPLAGMNSVYIANVLNGLVVTAVFIGYACVKNRRFPTTIEQLMVIPEDFGVSEGERIDISVNNMDEVVTISERVHDFCLERGIDEKRSYLAALCMEEMAGNVISHGFTKDSKSHSVDIRVVHKDDELILRIKDDCVPFDPAERQQVISPDDPTKNIGIRMVYSMVKHIEYQNILGLNVLTMKI